MPTLGRYRIIDDDDVMQAMLLLKRRGFSTAQFERAMQALDGLDGPTSREVLVQQPKESLAEAFERTKNGEVV